MQEKQLLHYFQTQQTPPGWFDLLNIMLEGMVSNAGYHDSRPFLNQMGETLADRYPLPLAATVGELEQQINTQLARFNWGYIEIEANEKMLIIHHQALPVTNEQHRQQSWSQAFSAVLEGLYARWLIAQGGQPHVSLWQEPSHNASAVTFRYQTRT